MSTAEPFDLATEVHRALDEMARLTASVDANRSMLEAKLTTAHRAIETAQRANKRSARALWVSSAAIACGLAVTAVVFSSVLNNQQNEAHDRSCEIVNRQESLVRLMIETSVASAAPEQQAQRREQGDKFILALRAQSPNLDCNAGPTSATTTAIEGR